MKFTKMHGCGNDYVYVDGMKYQIPDESAAAKKLSDRHFSIGGDGLIIIKKGTKMHAKARNKNPFIIIYTLIFCYKHKVVSQQRQNANRFLIINNDSSNAAYSNF